MTPCITPDLTRIAGRLITKALDVPEITHEGVTYCLTDEGDSSSAVLWRINPATYREEQIARVRLTVEVEK